MPQSQVTELSRPSPRPIAHPLASMVSSLGVPIEHFKIERSATRVHRVRDAYLEPLGSSGLRSDLIETLNVACPLGKLGRTPVATRTDRGGIFPDDRTAPSAARLRTFRGLWGHHFGDTRGAFAAFAATLGRRCHRMDSISGAQADLLNALYQANHTGLLAGQLGAPYFIPQHQNESAVRESRHPA
jgi:hypothetical protein